jgi:hypothetical protein
MGTNLDEVLAAARQLPPDQQRELARRLARESQPPAQPDWIPIAPKVIGRTAPRDRSREYAWLAHHRDEYAGEWVALDGDRLLAHGIGFEDVSRAMDGAGVPDALVILVEENDAPPVCGLLTAGLTMGHRLTFAERFVYDPAEGGITVPQS